MCGETIRSRIMATRAVQRVLAGVDVCCITFLIGSPGSLRGRGLLIRLEWVCGSLEITHPLGTDAIAREIFFGPSGIQLSRRSLGIENVRELHVVGCFYQGDPESLHFHVAMPNLFSIPFHCEGPRVFELLTPTDPSSLYPAVRSRSRMRTL